MNGRVAKRLRLKALEIWEKMTQAQKNHFKTCKRVYKLVKRDYYMKKGGGNYVQLRTKEKDSSRGRETSPIIRTP